MRHSVFALAILATPAWADDFTVLAPVTEAEIYLTGAMLTRAATVDLPAGDHRLLIPHVVDGAAPRLTVTGATLGPVETLPNAVADGRTALTDEQRNAYDAWQMAIAVTQSTEDARLRTAAAMKSAEDALTVLRSMSGATLETLQPDAVGAFAAAVSSNVTAAEIARADARQALRDAEKAVRDANLVQTQALLDFNASGGQLDAVSLMAVGVTLAEAGTVSLEMDVFSANAGWSPSYDIALTTDDTVIFDRKASIYQSTGLPFTDVALTLSTVDPYAQISPRSVGPNQAVLNDPRKSSLSRSSAGVALEAAPGVGEDVFIAASPVRTPARQALTANSDGVVVTYDYPSTVSLAPGGSELVLAIDSVSLDARVFNRAAVRSDRTAFLMAEIINTIGEPLLPGQATFYREDVRIGEAFLPLIPAGDDADLSFGPQQFLRVEFVLLENETGDRGLFTTSGTRRQDMVFRIRNLSNEAAEVEARYGLPFSEEEDLEIAITTRPQPTTQDVDDLQSVAEWVLDVPASGEAAVNIGVALEWPEGQTLIWNP